MEISNNDTLPLAGHPTVSGKGFDGLPKLANKKEGELKSSQEKRRERKFIMTPELLRIPELGNIQIRVDSVTQVTGPGVQEQLVLT